MSSSFQTKRSQFFSICPLQCKMGLCGHMTRKEGLLSKLILSRRLQGACLTHFRCSRSSHTMDKLITNHAYLFIKQGLGEIHRGNTVLTSFNLQSVIKGNTAARLQPSWLNPTFFLNQADPFSKGLCLSSGRVLSSSLALQLYTGCSQFEAVPSAACSSVSSSVKWRHGSLPIRIPSRNRCWVLSSYFRIYPIIKAEDSVPPQP